MRGFRTVARYDREELATEHVVDRYLARMPGAREAYQNDPTYHAQIAFMRRVFSSIDMAMEDEGVSPAVRLRVLQSVMYGAPYEPDAINRIIDLAQATKEAERD
jgi:hypothetical protein